MLHYDRIYIFECIDTNKTSASKECIICHHRYLLDKGFKFPLTAFTACHDVFNMSLEINSINILNIHDVDYCWYAVGLARVKP